MTTKRILFYVCFFCVVLGVMSTISVFSVITMIVSVLTMFSITSDMTSEGVYELVGANWLNDKFNTNSFTEE